MSAKYETLKARWDMGYITIATLKRWVAVEKAKPGSGITEQEFELITNQPYEE